MPVWRVTITDVKADRSAQAPEGMTVEIKPSLMAAETEKAGNAELVKADYKLVATYKPNVGSIEVGGSIYFIGLDADKALSEGRIKDPEVVKQAYQRIFREPMVVAIGLAKELMLPLPVKMPEITVESGPAGETKKK